MAETRRDLTRLLLLSLLVRLVTAAVVTRPGYMDVAYYTAGAVRVARGGGLTEPFIWNYLDNPAGLPRPGFLYWMPLPSLLAAPSAALFPGSFFALQLPCAVLSALLPCLAYIIAREATGRRRAAWLAGLFTLFSGFFFPYWTLPETFAPFAVFGGAALWLAGRGASPAGRQKTAARWLLVGLLVGLAHLTRPDGPLLLPVVVLGAALSRRRGNRVGSAESGAGGLVGFSVLLAFLGYLLIMAPWFARNLRVSGQALSPAGTRTIWLTDYDDLFCYDCDLSPASYLAWGWSEILRSKLWAMGVNLERFLAEDCLVFLLPFVLVGLYRLRRHPAFALCLVYLVLTFCAHSLVFTFPGPRGGFFHASVPALPLLFSAGAEGLGAAVGWAGRRRGWNLRQAQVVFAAAAVAAALSLSGYVAFGKLSAWRNADEAYVSVGRWLAEYGQGGATVMVANPPAYWYHTGQPAVVVPNGDVETLLAAAGRYDARHVVLDRNRPVGLSEVYGGDEPHPRLRPLVQWGEGVDRVVLYELEP
jgi:4-amino-4-deoxy-L-arabinose transferase-like glycosyltransferase